MTTTVPAPSFTLKEPEPAIITRMKPARHRMQTAAPSISFFPRIRIIPKYNPATNKMANKYNNISIFLFLSKLKAGTGALVASRPREPNK